MTVGFDAFATHPTGDTGTLTFTPAGIGASIAGAVVKVYELSTTRGVTGVTYGGNAMTLLGEVSKATGEAGTVSAWGLFSSVPGGSQEIVVSVSGTFNRNAVVNTYTGGDDLELVDLVTVSGDSVADPAATLELTGKASAISLAFVSGQGSANGVTPFAGWSVDQEVDPGAQVAGVYSYDTIGTADVSAGLTQTADDIVLLALAVAEVSGGGSTSVAADDIAQSQTLDQATITQSHTLQAVGLSQAQALDAPIVSSSSAVAAQDLAQAQVLESPSIVTAGQVSADDLAQAQAVDAASIVQRSQLSAVDLAQAQTVDSPAVLANRSISLTGSPESLAALGINLVGTWDVGTLTVTYNGNTLAPDNVTNLLVTFDAWPLLAALATIHSRYNTSYDLVVTDNGGSETISVATAIPAGWQLITVTSLGGIFADDIDLDIGDLALGHATVGAVTIDGDGDPTATQLPAAYEYYLDDGTVWGGPAVENFPASAVQILAVDLDQAQTLDSASVVQSHQLQAVGLSQAQAMDAASVTQATAVAAEDLNQSQSLDNPSVTQAHALSADDLEQAQTLDAPAVAVSGSLAAVDLEQGQTLDNPSLTQAGAVSALDLVQAQTLESPVLGFVASITAVDLSQAQSLDAPSLVAQGVLVPVDLQQAQFLDVSTLVQQGVLVPVDLVQSMTLGSGSVVLPTFTLPTGRTFVVMAEPRTWVVGGN